MKVQDPFGRALLDHLEGDRKRTHFIEREDGLIEVGDAACYFATYEEWPSCEKCLLEEVSGKILDVGCGAGRHSLHLQNLGFDVMGIDSSPLALEVCRRRGLKKMQRISFGEIEARKFDTFDTILMLGHNFGLFENIKRGRELLGMLHAMMSPRGKIVTTSRDPRKTDDPVHKSYLARNRQRGRATGQIKMRVRYKNLTGDWFDYLFVSSDTMRLLVAKTGWQIEKVIASDGASYLAVLTKET